MTKLPSRPQIAYRRFCKLFAALGAAFIVTLPIVSPERSFADKNQSVTGSTTEGAWGEPFDLGIIAINAALLPTGKVLFWQFISGTSGGSRAELWDASGTITDVSIPYEHDAFCSGHTALADGRIFVAGGVVWGAAGSEVGVTHSDFFDPFTETWSAGPEMEYPRWYPDVKEAADGSVYVFGGQVSPGMLVNDTERYDPVTNTFSTLPSSADIGADIYSRTILLPDGRIFMAGQNQETDVLDLNTQSWSYVGEVTYGSRLNGNAFLLPGLEKVMVIGGGAGGPNADATPTTEIIDFSQPTPTWTYSTPMNYARQYFTSTYLPDGKILVIGGVLQDKYIDPAGPAEMFDPDTATWTVLATAPIAKAHHSTAILLPDGRVWSAGGDGYLPMRSYAQIYSPPYYFRNNRPTITSAPTNLTYNQRFSITTPNLRQITKVSLVRLGTTTHVGTFDQRYLLLDFKAKNGSLQVNSPIDSAHAPPGYYMLFILNSKGTPSVASMVQIQ